MPRDVFVWDNRPRKTLGRLELLGQAVAATVRGQQEDVEQRMQIPTREFPAACEAFRTCLKTAGVRNSRIEPINDLARRRWRARFLALAICRSSMMGLVVVNPIIAGTAFSCASTFSATTSPGIIVN